MAQIKKNDVILYGGYAVGAFIAYKVVTGLLVNLGLMQSGPAAEAAKAAAKARLDELNKIKRTTGLSRPQSDFYSAADTIYNGLKYSSLDDDANAAQYAFTYIINNAADYAFLKYVYGVRPTYNFGLKQGDFDLLTTLQREFSTDRYNETVAILKGKGVTM